MIKRTTLKQISDRFSKFLLKNGKVYESDMKQYDASQSQLHFQIEQMLVDKICPEASYFWACVMRDKRKI